MIHKIVRLKQNNGPLTRKNDSRLTLKANDGSFSSSAVNFEQGLLYFLEVVKMSFFVAFNDCHLILTLHLARCAL